MAAIVVRCVRANLIIPAVLVDETEVYQTPGSGSAHSSAFVSETMQPLQKSGTGTAHTIACFSAAQKVLFFVSEGFDIIRHEGRRHFNSAPRRKAQNATGDSRSNQQHFELLIPNELDQNHVESACNRISIRTGITMSRKSFSSFLAIQIAMLAVLVGGHGSQAQAGVKTQKSSGKPAVATSIDVVPFSSEVVNFSHPKQLGAKPVVKTVAAVKLASPDDKPDGVAPKHWEINFGPNGATLYIFPTSEGKLSAAEFRKLYPNTPESAAALAKLLKAPANKAINIPVLPWQDASTPFEAQRKQLTLKDGKAIRYIAEYLIEPDVIDSARLVYSAQGLTNNGKYYVSLVAPLKTSALPAKGDVSKMSRAASDKFSKDFPQYGKQVGVKLEALPATAFTPNLDSLDALVDSIVIGQRQ